MKLTIFSRLILGYLLLFIFAMGVSIYAIIQLRHLENLSESMFTIDSRLMSYEKALTDLVLSLIRSQKKYMVLKDEMLYKHFIETGREFEMKLDGAISLLEENDRVQDILIDIKNEYQKYREYFEKEAGGENKTLIRGDPEIAKEMEGSANRIINRLRDLKFYIQERMYDKISTLGKAQGRASRIAMSVGILSLAVALVVSVYITFTITRPLVQIKNRIREIARGEFRDDLNISSPPEIAELSHTFNYMCRKLKELDRVKTDFFSLMSHELRTPLTTIKEGANLMIEGVDQGMPLERQRRLLKIINEESERLIKLVNSLLDLSKMEAGMMPFNFTNTDLAILVNQVIKEMEPLAETKKIKISTVIENDIPPVKADMEKILQALRNLVSNAIKFTHEGGEVRIKVSKKIDGVQVSVMDTGVGIPRENIQTIFDKYYQVTHGGSNKKFKGTGLGLSIVKHIIDAHGGKIWAESELGKGSTFTFVLPA